LTFCESVQSRYSAVGTITLIPTMSNKWYGSSDTVQISKTLTWLLRHSAWQEGLYIDEEGFVLVKEILDYMNYYEPKTLNFTRLKQIVDDNDKKRFLMEKSSDGQWKIRANQGHTMKRVKKLQLELVKSCPVCIHGTYFKSWKLIVATGLSRMGRNHIHMCTGIPGSSKVISGMRYSAQVAIYINVAKAIKNGIKFFKSSNGVILSSGDSKGYIRPQFFKKAVALKTRKILFQNK